MFLAIIKDRESGESVLELKTENRNYLKPLVLVCRENGLDCELTEEVKPRPVKLRGVD